MKKFKNLKILICNVLFVFLFAKEDYLQYYRDEALVFNTSEPSEIDAELKELYSNATYSSEEIIPQHQRRLDIPEDPFTEEEINSGYFVLYFLGILYMFLGILLIHKDFVVPTLDKITKSGYLSTDSMEVTLVAFASSAPEVFICIFSTIFEVSEVGISTVLCTNAFTILVGKGLMFLLAGSLGQVDWYSFLRDTLTFMVVLLVIAILMLDSIIKFWNSLIMLFLYFVYTIFMKFNRKVEKIIRNEMRLRDKFKLPKRLEEPEIDELHYNQDSRRYSIKQLSREQFTFIENDEYVAFLYKGLKRTAPAKKYIPENSPQVLTRFIDAVNFIIGAIACKEAKEKLIRNATYQIDLIHVPHIEHSHRTHGSSQFDDDGKKDYLKPHREPSVSLTRRNIDILNKKPKRVLKIEARNIPPENIFHDKGLEMEFEALEKRRKESESKNDIVAVKETRIVKAMKNDKQGEEENESRFSELRFPDSVEQRLFYIITIPLKICFFFSIPDPRKNHRINLPPLIFLICLIWIGVFSFFITWWLVTLSQAFGLHYLILPMFVVPFGLILRDLSKFREFYLLLKTLTEEKVELPECYSSNIFQFTVGTSLGWLIYTLIFGEIELQSQGIYVQIFLLLAVVVAKLILVIIFKFKTRKSMFPIQLFIYILYIVCVIIVDYAF